MSSSSEEQYEQCETQFGQFKVLKNDFIGKWMLRGKHFEVECIEPILAQLNSGDVVIDVGANIGCYTIPFAQAVGSTGQVHSFEPQGVIHQLLEHNVSANELNNVRTYHMAVGHQNGEATLNRRCDRGREIKYDRNEETNFGGVNLGIGGEKVKMVNLSDFVDQLDLEDRQVKLIKIDVEGAEKMVIEGAKRLIERDRPIVFFEENYKALTREMIEMFNLSDEIVKMNIRSYFKNELKYSQIIKIKENFLCIP